MAEIQLKRNWAGYVPGTKVSVSDERADYLVKELKIASYTPEQKEINKKKVTNAKKKSSVKGK